MSLYRIIVGQHRWQNHNEFVGDVPH